MSDRLTRVTKRMRMLASLADQALVSGGNFLTIAICAHLLPLVEQGKLTYVFASYMALLLLNVSGIFQGAAVRAPTQDGLYQPALARLQLIQAILLSFVVCVAWFGGGGLFGWQATLDEATLLFAFLTLQQLADFDRRSAYIFSGTSRAVYSSAVLYPLRIIVLLLARPETVSQVLWVLILSALLSALPALLMVGKRQSVTLNWVGEVKAHLSYSRLFIAGAPMGWLWSYIPIFMLGTMHGKGQAALLASIRGIANIANVLMEQIETKVIADWAKIRHAERAEVMDAAAVQLLKIGMGLWLIGLLTIAFLGRDIVTLLLGDLYSPHWNLLFISWVGYGVYFMARVYGIKHRALGSNRIEFVGNLGGVLAALIACFMLIPSQQAVGAAWAYVIIAVVMGGSQMYLMKRLVRG